MPSTKDYIQIEKKRGGNITQGHIVIDISPLEYFRYLTIQDFPFRQFKCVYKQDIDCHRYFETPLLLL